MDPITLAFAHRFGCAPTGLDPGATAFVRSVGVASPYQHVAVLGLMLGTYPEHGPTFEHAIGRLARRRTFRPGRTRTLEQDARALFGLAVGVHDRLAREVVHDRSAGEVWLTELAEEAERQLDCPWRLGMLRSARLILGEPIALAALPPELAAAMIDAELIPEASLDRVAVDAALTLEHSRAPERIAVQLAAIRWLKQPLHLEPGELDQLQSIMLAASYRDRRDLFLGGIDERHVASLTNGPDMLSDLMRYLKAFNTNPNPVHMIALLKNVVGILTGDRPEHVQVRGWLDRIRAKTASKHPSGLPS